MNFGIRISEFGFSSLPIAKCRLPIGITSTGDGTSVNAVDASSTAFQDKTEPIGNLKLAIGNELNPNFRNPNSEFLFSRC